MALEGLGDDALEDVEEGEAAAGGALAEELGEGGDAAHADGGGGVGVERLHERHHDLLEEVGLVHVPVGQHRLRHDGQALGPHGVAVVGPERRNRSLSDKSIHVRGSVSVSTCSTSP